MEHHDAAGHRSGRSRFGDDPARGCEGERTACWPHDRPSTWSDISDTLVPSGVARVRVSAPSFEGGNDLGVRRAYRLTRAGDALASCIGSAYFLASYAWPGVADRAPGRTEPTREQSLIVERGYDCTAGQTSSSSGTPDRRASMRAVPWRAEARVVLATARSVLPPHPLGLPGVPCAFEWHRPP